MTKDEAEIAITLNTEVRFIPASRPKKFIKDIAYVAQFSPSTELTPKQEAYLYGILYKFRRQVPNLYEKHKENR